MGGIQGYSNSKKDWGVTDYYFIDLVLMLASSAKIDLGELVHPYYKDKVLDLARARVTINMINSLVKKTANNLNVEEKKVLKEVVEDLQATYVEKANLNKMGSANPGANKPAASRPLIPAPPPTGKPNVKEWISMVQQELAKKKQGQK